MTSLTFEQARVEIITLVNTAWLLGPVNPVPTLVKDFNNTFTPVVGSPWARVTVRFGDAGQVGPSPLGVNAALFRRFGLAMVDIFVQPGSGVVTLNALAKVAQDAFEGKTTTSGVWFRDTRYRPFGVEDSWFHAQVMSEFIYDEIK